MASVKVRRYGSVMMWKSYYDEEMPPQLYPTVSKDEYRESIRRINAIYRPLPWMKWSLIGGCLGVLLGFLLIPILILSFQSPAGAGAGFVVCFASVIFLACVNQKITNTVRLMLATATAYENEVYKDRIPPVRWTVEEWRLVTTTVTTGGRGGPRTSRSSQTFFDLYVEVGQAVQPQMVVHQHIYGAPPPGQYGQPQYGQPQYGMPPQGFAPQQGYAPQGYPQQGGYPPQQYPPQQWSPNHAPPPSQGYYGGQAGSQPHSQPHSPHHAPAAGQQWPQQAHPQMQGAAPPQYNHDDPLGSAPVKESLSSSLLSGNEASDA